MTGRFRLLTTMVTIPTQLLLCHSDRQFKNMFIGYVPDLKSISLHVCVYTGLKQEDDSLDVRTPAAIAIRNLMSGAHEAGCCNMPATLLQAVAGGLQSLGLREVQRSRHLWWRYTHVWLAWKAQCNNSRKHCE